MFYREINVIIEEETKICFTFVIVVNHFHRGGGGEIDQFSTSKLFSSKCLN